jgi:uncharacterized protein (TIGR03905 family)
MKFEYIPKGVCSMKMIFEIEGAIIKNLEIIGGCPGNTTGVALLVKGRNVDDIINMLKGIPCRNKGTSCPDQVSAALEEYKRTYL